MRSFIILILLVALAFGNSLQNSFVWDDNRLVLKKEILSIFTTPLWENSLYYRPVLNMFVVFNYKLWGPNPLGFHFINILLHLINAILLYRVGLLLFDNDNKKLISLIAASIFAIHPVHNESVGRSVAGEPLFGLFIILCLYFFLKEKRFLSLLTFSLALLSKEFAVMFPFALAILAIPEKGINPVRKDISNGVKRGMVEIIPYMVLVGLYLLLRKMVVGTVFGGRVDQPIFTRVLTMAVATLDYLRLLLIPYPISPFYPARWYTSILEPKVMIAMLVLISIVFLAFKSRKDKVMLFLLLFPFIMLAPVIWKVNSFLSGLDQMYIAERFLYVPAILFPFFVIMSALKLKGSRKNKYLVIGWLFAVMVFVMITISSNRIWKNNLILFSTIVKESPTAASAHLELGNIYCNQGRLNEAIEKYSFASRLRPDYAEAHNNLCIAYSKMGRLNEALEACFSALRLRPDYANAHNNIGNVYLNLGHIDSAIKHYQTALRVNSRMLDAHYNLGIIYQQRGLINEAIKEFQAALKIQPDLIQARQYLESLQR